MFVNVIPHSLWKKNINFRTVAGNLRERDNPGRGYHLWSQ